MYISSIYCLFFVMYYMYSFFCSCFLKYAKGGPIIAFQIENEFSSYSIEVEHLKTLKKVCVFLKLKNTRC